MPTQSQASDANLKKMAVLVIEDDRTIGKSLVQGFEEAGFFVQWAMSGTVGLEHAQNQQADVIVLDLMLPGLSGLEVLRTLRQLGIQTPVVVLTAKGSIDDRVEGLQLGADDYLVKPFAFVELRARIEAVCRRTTTRPSATLKSGNVELDLSIHRVLLGDKEIELTPTEFSIMELLLRHAGQVVTRKMLCEHVWGFEWDGPTNVIEVHIARLRRKLDKDTGHSCIETVRGRGYSIHKVNSNTQSSN